MPQLIAGEPQGLHALLETGEPGAGWDAFVAAHPAGHLMQSRAWAGVQRELGREPLFLGVHGPGGLRAACLILAYRIRPIPASLLYIPRGPVVDYGDAEALACLDAGLGWLARARRAFLIQTDPAIPLVREEAHAALGRLGLRRVEKQGLFRLAQPLRVMRIPLDAYGGPDGLLAALPHKTRYNIGLARRKGVTVTPRSDRDACAAFHRLLVETGRAKGFPVRGLRFHQALWRHCVEPGGGEYLFAEHAGRTLAAIHLLRFGARTWYMYGATGIEDRQRMAPYLLHWEGICRAWAAGSTCYDMRGVYSATPRPGDAEYGVYDFKRKFNAELVTFLGEYDRVERPGAYRTWRWLEGALQGPAGVALRLRSWWRG